MPRLTALVFLATLALSLTGRPAEAAVYWDKVSILKSFFANSERVTFKRLVPTPDQVALLRQRLGYAPPREVTVYFGMTRDRIDGLAVIDNELGQHLPITFGALVGTEGALKRLEVMVYREAYGEEVREPRFRQQFQGKTALDPLKPGRDIVAVAGATISSKSMATGSKRALVLIDELVLRPGLARVLLPVKVAATPDKPAAHL